jgi:hypothetical protein
VRPDAQLALQPGPQSPREPEVVTHGPRRGTGQVRYLSPGQTLRYMDTHSW